MHLPQQVSFDQVLPVIKALGALEWLTHIAISQGVHIQHAGKSNEKVLGMKKLRADA